MAPLQKQSISVNFSQGLDTKTDPFQVSLGRFLSLENSVFDTGGRLTKRNGYQQLTTLPDQTYKYVTTFNGNLTAVGTFLSAYSAGSMNWVTKGTLQPINLNVLAGVRNNTNQTQADSVTASNGLTCIAYTDVNGSTKTYKYTVIDSTTGQSIIAPTALSTADATYGTPRVFLLGNYFIILFTTHPSSYNLQYIAIGVHDTSIITSSVDIATGYTPSSTLAFDAIAVNNRLYIAYNTTSGGQSINVTYITNTLSGPVSPTVFTTEIATMFSLAVDSNNASSPIIYVSYYNLPTTTGKTLAVDTNLNQVLSPTTWTTTETVLNLISYSNAQTTRILYEISNTYSYDSTIATHYIDAVTVTQSGTVGTPETVVRSVGLASKAFNVNGSNYFLALQDSLYQPTYFLLNSSGNVVSKLAYSNAPTYYTAGVANVTVLDQIAYLSYLYKDQLTSVNKTQGIANAAGVYAQLGVNIASFDFDPVDIITAEIGQNLNIPGGIVTSYDGVSPVEQNFFLWPELDTNLDSNGTSKALTVSTTGGSMTAQDYFYIATYEWADNRGNIFRSAPSIPIPAAAASFTGTTSSVTVHVPTLRLTYKTANPVKIVLYRWSTAQQTYYQVTSITAPLLNDTTGDSVQFVDTHADSSILGNSILYTTGGVIENIAPPASNLITLFNNRLWMVDSEDRNLLWFSKQVIEATPVEMSDLLTLYVAPTTASQGSTGPITSIAPMDDKLIIFKRDALGYINGIGPDNTGANSQYSDFILINSVVGCSNQQSIVFTPNGLMFQSDKGIWLLGRDLSTSYIGAPVEKYTQAATVLSALNIPATNQVRFTLSTGITLMYDYYYGQWGTFTNVPAISSTVYQNLHTYINVYGQVFQEHVGSYLDGSSPVKMAFTTSWLNLAGVQGFERFYQLYLLGQYLTPFNLSVSLAFDYNSSPVQTTIVTPTNSYTTWGNDALWGSGSTWGNGSNVLEARIFPSIQKCESFQITISEIPIYTPGVTAGAGFTLSGLNIVAGMKKGYRTQSSAKSFG